MHPGLENAAEGKTTLYRVEVGGERGKMSRIQGKKEVKRELRMTKFIHHLFNEQPLTVRMALDAND